ncbi:MULTISPECIES: SLC13 family permease [unclassified Methylophaga]|uniref:SLC13 family permease n=1 Tax=unclassified Methylophaga TaxID=2629249 RepID=UPI000C9974D9|nr:MULTISPECIES: SLC13 family permease [unclassified Methylophaga]MAY17085.1 SLC13 family permease [Methylophaga sp.]HCD05019.1 SLC13 family permease [Methylophaga sp.]|tara:strand:- start:23059 stop:24864 length:1806 start_codon:yes stop_codon:yes gene_type:complete
MTTDQIIIFAVLAATLGLFIWDRLRYDVVAVLALLAVALTGLIPADEVFSGLGHPAVITVAAVLILGQALVNAGVVDAIARQLTRVGNHPTLQMAALTITVAICSGFMNNVGALALLMPVAIWMSRQSGHSPSMFLMPLAFGSLLGGCLTLIGTPPNIIIASYRIQTDSPAFGMFDFLPVGIAITVVGVIFLILLGRFLTPQRQVNNNEEELFEISSYLTELTVPEKCEYSGRSLMDLVTSVEDEADITVVALLRQDERFSTPSMYRVLRQDDVLLIEADSDSLKALTDITGLKLSGDKTDPQTEAEKETSESIKTRDLDVVEAILAHDSLLVGNTLSSLSIRQRYGINILAVARRGHQLKQRLHQIRFVAGDILLMQGSEEVLKSVMVELGCLPLASRGLRLGQPRKVVIASLVFAAVIALIMFDTVSTATAMVAGVVAMFFTGLLPVTKIYQSLDLPVIVLLAAMLPVGQALETTGGSELIASFLLNLAQSTPPAATIIILMVATMLLSNIINNAAAAILAAPIAISVASGMDVSADPLLMAVAIGASCAFLTPIAHQSNTLVMEPGGYSFTDYWRLGLPLSILVILTAVPVILWVWPL